MQLTEYQIVRLRDKYYQQYGGENHFPTNEDNPNYEGLEKELLEYVKQLKITCFSECIKNCPSAGECRKEKNKTTRHSLTASRKQLSQLLHNYIPLKHDRFYEGFVELCCRFVAIDWEEFKNQIESPASNRFPSTDVALKIDNETFVDSTSELGEDVKEETEAREKNEKSLLGKIGDSKINIGIWAWRIASLVLGFGLICTLLTHFLSKPTTKQFLLSSTGGIKSPWISSGIRVEAGDKIEIYPSGKINLAMHHAMETAIKDTIFPIPNWSFPEGFLIPDSILTDIQRIKENTRDNRRLKKAPMGRLLWYISEEEPISPISNQDDIQEYELGKNEYSCDKSGILWFSINEVWIYQEYFDSFHARDFYLDEKVWNWLKKNKRYGIWYEDNVGDFNITLTVK